MGTHCRNDVRVRLKPSTHMALERSDLDGGRVVMTGVHLISKVIVLAATVAAVLNSTAPVDGRTPIPKDHTPKSVHSGRSLFAKSFAIHEGLGPRFNAASCASCHDSPAAGGSGTGRDTWVEWTFVDAGDMLGSPAQRLALSSDGATIRSMARSNERRKPPALFGLGHLETIPVEHLRSRSDPSDTDGDGISGRLPWREDCVGRFGWQSSVCDLETFVVSALSREMGIESLPTRRREISESDLQDLVAYVRSLPPPPAAQSQHDKDLFERAGCATCHTPVTGVAAPAGERIEVLAYTDLLVHEMGSGSRHGQKGSRTEFRTPPLWGVASTGPPYLHDGSAATLEHAIGLHGGEAEHSGLVFSGLSRGEKERLLTFVSSR